MQPIPVIAIDGPSASGKGTVAQRLAERLGFHYLDSGAIYRATAVAVDQDGRGEAADPAATAVLAADLDLSFREGRIWLAAHDITSAARSERAGQIASRVAAMPAVRAALLQRQRDFRRPPGLVADGRDMGSVVFPDAMLKVFLTAGVAVRAHRRALQLAQAEAPKGLIDKEKDAMIAPLFDALVARVTADLIERDRRDTERAVAPLRCLPDALELDTTDLTIEAAVDRVESWFRRAQSARAS